MKEGDYGRPSLEFLVAVAQDKGLANKNRAFALLLAGYYYRGS